MGHNVSLPHLIRHSIIGEITMIENLEEFISSMQHKEGLNNRILNTTKENRLRVFIRINIPKLPNIQGKEIKDIRETIDCSQALFAEIMGVSKNTVEYWESGKNVPKGSAQRLLALIKIKKLTLLKKICKKLDQEHILQRQREGIDISK